MVFKLELFENVLKISFLDCVKCRFEKMYTCTGNFFSFEDFFCFVILGNHFFLGVKMMNLALLSCF